MNGYTIGLKLFDKLSKPVNVFFGSDERSFITFLGLTIASYIAGFPDAATILAVYSSVFMYSGMEKYSDDSNTVEQETAFDEEKMMNLMGQAGEALEEIQEEKDGGEDN